MCNKGASIHQTVLKNILCLFLQDGQIWMHHDFQSEVVLHSDASKDRKKWRIRMVGEYVHRMFIDTILVTTIFNSIFSEKKQSSVLVPG